MTTPKRGHPVVNATPVKVTITLDATYDAVIRRHMAAARCSYVQAWRDAVDALEDHGIVGVPPVIDDAMVKADDEPVEHCEGGCAEPVTHNGTPSVSWCDKCWDELASEAICSPDRILEYLLKPEIYQGLSDDQKRHVDFELQKAKHTSKPLPLAIRRADDSLTSLGGGGRMPGHHRQWLQFRHGSRPNVPTDHSARGTIAIPRGTNLARLFCGVSAWKCPAPVIRMHRLP